MIQFNLTGIIQLAVGSSVELVSSETCDISANFSKKTELSTHSLHRDSQLSSLFLAKTCTFDVILRYISRGFWSSNKKRRSEIFWINNKCVIWEKLTIHTNTVGEIWWSKGISDRTKTSSKLPVTCVSYSWCRWSIVRTTLSNHCTTIHQDGVRAVHT